MLKIRRFATPLLVLFGSAAGIVLLESGARVAAVVSERREGRLDRDEARLLPPPRNGAPATLGQIIRRSVSPSVVYELRPRLDVTFAGAPLTTSDRGHRGTDVAIAKPGGTLRIVGIGDSYLFGQGVADDETYMARLPALLQATSVSSAVETVNLGVPGYNTVMEVAALENDIGALTPDVILIEIVGNDLDLPNFLWADVDPWTLRRSFLLEFVERRLARSRMSEEQTGLVESPNEASEDGKRFSRDRVPERYAHLVGLPRFEEAIARLGELGRRTGARVLALSHGVWFEKDMVRSLEINGIPLLLLRTALRQRARELGAPDYARSPLALAPNDLHPSRAGHQAVAEELSRWLKERLPGS